MADVNDIIFSIVDEDTVKRLQDDGEITLPKKKIAIPKDQEWNKKQMASKILQGIEEGSSIDKIADSLTDVIGNNIASAIRNARTMVTSAENHGRLDSYKSLSDQGVVIKKEWEATPDDRTRPSHRDIDGEEQDIDKVFSNGCMFPGDGKGPAEEVWMCRCSMGSHIIGFRRADGSISKVEYTADRTTHEDQMEELLKKIINATANNNAYSYLGNVPQRPRASAYGGYTDEFYEARELYYKERDAFNDRVEKWYLENVDTRSMTIDELKEWCKKNDCIIYGSLDGLDGVALRNYTQRHEQLSKDFPFVKEYHRRTGHPFEIAYDPNGSFDAEASHGMTFGRTYENFHDQVVKESAYCNGVDFVHGQNPAVRVFDHEFGHQVYDAMQYGRDKELLNSTREELERRISMEKDLISTVYSKKGMSEYAETNAHELFAEGFAAWYGGEKTEFAKAFGEFLGRWL